MTLAVASRVGPFELLGSLGRGGLLRSRSIRLGRELGRGSPKSEVLASRTYGHFPPWFILTRAGHRSDDAPLVIVENRFEELKTRVPAGRN
jgi:hypothetical protein